MKGAKIEEIRWQITMATWMQPLQYDLRSQPQKTIVFPTQLSKEPWRSHRSAICRAVMAKHNTITRNEALAAEPRRSNSIAICYPCLANHNRKTSAKRSNTNMKAAIPMENARLDHQTHWHSAFKFSKISSAQRWLWGPLERAANENRTRHTDKVPPIDAGRHFMRESTGFRAVSKFHKSPARSNHCDLQSVPCKSQ